MSVTMTDWLFILESILYLFVHSQDRIITIGGHYEKNNDVFSPNS